MRLRTATALSIVVSALAGAGAFAEKAPAVPPPYRDAKLAVDARVADLVVDACVDGALADRVATLISAHCLVGWDTGGVPWEDVS